ncbi:MAG: hypothetical protein ABI742_06785, partial [Gemmatimonadota bacterium]
MRVWAVLRTVQIATLRLLVRKVAMRGGTACAIGSARHPAYRNRAGMNRTPWQNRKAQLTFGSAIVTLLLVGAISYRSLTLSSDGDLWVRHSHEVLVKCYESRANCYLSRPVQLQEFESTVSSINDFWLTRAKLPQQRQP